MGKVNFIQTPGNIWDKGKEKDREKTGTKNEEGPKGTGEKNN